MEIPADLVEAFTEAVPFALREMAQVEVVVRESRAATAADDAADLCAGVRLTGAADWRLILCLPGRTAEALAGRVFAGAVADVTADLVRDCMGEVTNVVAGQAKALLVGRPSHFMLSTPTVHAGAVEAAGGWVIRFESDAGALAVRLCDGEPGRVSAGSPGTGNDVAGGSSAPGA